MPHDERDAIAEIAQALRVYIATNPTAADTVAGIQQWWLPRAQDESLPLVELALDRLVQEGVLRREPMRDGGVLYAGAAAVHGPERR